VVRFKVGNMNELFFVFRLYGFESWVFWKKNGLFLSHVFGVLLISIINIYFYCALVNSA
jgi:hypothetical protein